ncbi:MAG: GNAT family N-acetyltransferase [Nanoarchaeota archaeon]
MEIETKRLILKQVSEGDSLEIAKIGNDREISYFTYYWPYPLTESKVNKILREIEKEWKEKKTVIMFKIQLKDNGNIIGVIDIFDINKTDKNAKVGYWLGKDYRGNGYALEALKEAIDFSFNKLKLEKLFADTLTNNISSNKLLKKAGFRKIGTMEKDKLIEGNFIDRYLWELINKN